MVRKSTWSRSLSDPAAYTRAVVVVLLATPLGFVACSDDGTGGSVGSPNRMPFALQEGPTTVTNYDGGAQGKCGLTGSEVQGRYPGYTMAAIPGAFFSDISPLNGTVSCSPESGIVVDDQGDPLCYKLTGQDGSEVMVVVADVCGGGCSQNVADCGNPDAQPEPTCSTIASCLDCTDFATQFEDRWRCPPAMECLTQTQGTEWPDFMGPILAATMGLNQGTEGCEVSDFIPSGLFPNANVDWCSGDNAHFDIWNDTSSLTNPSPTVVEYERMDCPDPADGT
ncbi:MAG: hypothetical protein AAF500_16465 [Myxococcota bacterium]